MAHDTGAQPHDDSGRTPWLGYLSLAASMSMVGASVALAKPLMAAFPVFLLTACRFAIALLVLLALARRAPPLGRQPLAVHAWLFVLAFVGNVLFSLAMLNGVALSSAVAGGIVMAALPAAVALLAWLTLGERIGLRVGAGIVCAVGGVGLVAASKGGGGGGAAGAGLLLLVVALFCEASYTVIAKRLAGVVAPGRIALLTSAWGLALALPFGLFQAAAFDFRAVTTGDALLLLGYALMASVFSVWLWMVGVQRVSAARAGVFTAMVPISSALVGVLALGERLAAPQAAALALAFVGIVLAAGARPEGRSRAAARATGTTEPAPRR